MLVFAARRILQAIPILFGVSRCFGLVHIVPGNPINMLMPPEASPAVIAQMKAAFGFDKPLYVQYLLWLGRALQGDSASQCSMRHRCGGNSSLHSAIRSFSPSSLPHLAFHSAWSAAWSLRLHGRWPDKLFSAIAHRRQPAALLVRHRPRPRLRGAA